MWLGLICLIPAFFGAITMLIMIFGTPFNEVKITLVSQIAVGVGSFTTMIYLMGWAFMIFSDNGFWMSKDALDEATRQTKDVHHKYEQGLDTLSQKILFESAMDEQTLNEFKILIAEFKQPKQENK